MIWIVFGAMAVAGVLAVGRMLVEADPARIRKPARFASIACWIVGALMALTGKLAVGLTLMAIGAMGAGVFTRPPRARRSPFGERNRHRRSAGRRPHVEQDADAGGGEGDVRSASGVMTEEQAYQILGLKPGATPQDIARAHRALMKKVHPDQGGTTELAARVNAAKDVLTDRGHR